MIRILLSCVCLAGCGGGSVSDGASLVIDFPTFRQGIIDTGVTPLSEVPDSGDHRYQGQIALNLPFGSIPAEAYVGNFTLVLAVDSGSLDATGLVSGFTSGSGAELEGALAFGRGQLFPDADPAQDFLLQADLVGDLTKDGIDYGLSARISGDFYGQNADGLAGLVYAGVIRQGDDVDVFDGSFAGQATD